MEKSGISLVQIIIVITILGILAAIVLPGFQSHAAKAKESAVKSNLTTIRSQLEVYKLQHGGVPPGHVNGAGAPILSWISLSFVLLFFSPYTLI